MNTDPMALTVDIGVEGLRSGKWSRQWSASIPALTCLVNNAAIAGPTAMIPDIETSDWRQPSIPTSVALSTAASTCQALCGKQIGQYHHALFRGWPHGLSLARTLRGNPLGGDWIEPYPGSRTGPVRHTREHRRPRPDRGRSQQPGVRGQGGSGKRRCRGNQEFFTRDIPIGRMPTEQEVAKCVVYLASDASSGIHGQTIQVDGGFRMQ